MGSLGPARKRGLFASSRSLLWSSARSYVGVPPAGGWDHLGDAGAPGTDSLNLVASALTVTPGALYVGGGFTGGVPNADRIATWNGSNWNAVSSSTSQIENGSVSAIAVSGGKVYAGGNFRTQGTNRTPTTSRSGTARAGSRSAMHRPGRRSAGT